MIWSCTCCVREMAAEQAAVYAALRPYGRCFVRLCDKGGALWVTNLPRTGAGLRPAAAALQALDCRWREENGLWYIDWTASRWQRELEGLPQTAPPWPGRDELLPVYALCRLWLAHPAPLDSQPMDVLRAVRKLTWQSPSMLPQKAPVLHEAAAARLRSRLPMACGAGQMLAQWLVLQEETT